MNQNNLDNTLEKEKEWMQERMGKVTASNFPEFVKKGKDGEYFLSDSETAKNLIYKIAWERLVIDENMSEAMERLDINSKSIQHGNDYEGAAIPRYEEETGLEVQYINRYNSYTEDIGGTPDGYVGEDGMIEAKCPFNGGNHLRTLLTGEIYNKKYIYQIQGNLMITKRKWCDFITYDPDMPKGLDISINRIERDELMIKGIELVINQVADQVREIVKQTKAETL